MILEHTWPMLFCFVHCVFTHSHLCPVTASQSFAEQLLRTSVQVSLLGKETRTGLCDHSVLTVVMRGLDCGRLLGCKVPPAQFLSCDHPYPLLGHLSRAQTGMVVVRESAWCSALNYICGFIKLVLRFRIAYLLQLITKMDSDLP